MVFSEFIHSERIISNDVLEIEFVLGVEACQLITFREIDAIMKAEGVSLGLRHVLLLVEFMAYLGHMSPVNRHTLLKYGSSPLDAATYEEPVRVLSKAAYSHSIEPLSGSSNSLLFGQYLACGTSSFEVFMDFFYIVGCV